MGSRNGFGPYSCCKIGVSVDFVGFYGLILLVSIDADSNVVYRIIDGMLAKNKFKDFFQMLFNCNNKDEAAGDCFIYLEWSVQLATEQA